MDRLGADAPPPTTARVARAYAIPALTGQPGAPARMAVTATVARA